MRYVRSSGGPTVSGPYVLYFEGSVRTAQCRLEFCPRHRRQLLEEHVKAWIDKKSALATACLSSIAPPPVKNLRFRCMLLLE